MNQNVEIVSEHKSYIIINKPPGLIVHRGDLTKENEVTLTDLLIKKYPEIEHVGQQKRPGIVHRLDKDTSGIMIVARTHDNYDYFITQFKERRIQKTYQALVYGTVKNTHGTIAYSIKRSKKNYSKFTTSPGRDATTDYTVKHYCTDTSRKQEYTLLDVSPKTGRTHQIRVHLKAIGHPIVSDLKYCFKPQRKINPLPRLFLHASKIQFIDPDTQKEVVFSVALPNDLQTFLDTLQCS
ncbi:RluA family pseudouridine synthase [Patescibacteria group bacterium]|nr:RluA family pseudouridine synthase [Patescibacteria group bacterium]